MIVNQAHLKPCVFVTQPQISDSLKTFGLNENHPAVLVVAISKGGINKVSSENAQLLINIIDSGR